MHDEPQSAAIGAIELDEVVAAPERPHIELRPVKAHKPRASQVLQKTVFYVLHEGIRTGSHGEARRNPRAYDLVQSRQVRLHIAQLYRLHSAPDIHADEARRDAVRYRHCRSDDAPRSGVRVRHDADMRVARELLTTQLQNLRLRDLIELECVHDCLGASSSDNKSFHRTAPLSSFSTPSPGRPV